MDEARDGIDTLNWIAEQKWCNGHIGMVGKSYLGIVQIPAASEGHEALRCIVPGVAPNSFFRDRWTHLNDWPQPEAKMQNWYLNAGSGAKGLNKGGRLSMESPPEMSPDRYTYDLRNPTPTLGEPIYWGMSPLEPVDQRPILGRSDLLYYSSDALERSLSIVGEINLDLWIASSAPDTDLIAKLCVIEPNGRVICLIIGSIRCRFRESWSNPKALEAGILTRIRIHMGHIEYVYPERSKIALIITRSSFPRILPHPNTMASTWKEKFPPIAQQEIFHSQNYPSCLILPILEC